MFVGEAVIFFKNLDQVIKEECAEEKVQRIIQGCSRTVAESILAECIEERVRQEFKTQAAYELSKKYPSESWKILKETYLINQPITSANEAIDKVWETEEAKVTIAPSEEKKKKAKSITSFVVDFLRRKS